MSCYEKEIQRIVGREIGSYFFNRSFSQEELFQFATPLLQEENETLKKELIRKKSS